MTEVVYTPAPDRLVYQPERAVLQLHNGIRIDLGPAPMKLGLGVREAINAACYHLELINRTNRSG